MRKFILVVMAFLLSAVSASAAVTEINIEKDLSNKMITISGIALPDENVSIQILPEDVTIEDFKNSDSKNDIIEFVYEAKADVNGKFSVDAKLDIGAENSKGYKMYYATANKADAPKSKDTTVYSKDYYASKLALVNGKANATEFATAASAAGTIEVLGFDEDINDIVPLADTLKFMYEELDGNSLNADEYLDNVYLYRNSFAVLALNDDSIDEIYTYVKNIIDEDSNLKKYWDKYITNDEIEAFLIEKISGESIDSIEELKTKLEEGLVLAATCYPNGYISLYDLYTDYQSLIGLTAISSNSSVYKTIGGKSYADIAALKTAYDRAVAGLGSGSGSGGDKVSNKGSYESIQVGIGVGANNAALETITLKFLDLASFEWAYPSISKLYDEGIINGVSENQYAPRRQVKREEFVKMIVCAMNLETKTGSDFKDVDNAQWYAPYVYSAYYNNIINGISKNEFGTSKNITRQDMAVIIYNAIKAKGYQNTQAQILFNDKDDIADYAKEAVGQLVSLGIINGMDGNRFAPTEESTRAQAAVVIERALQYLR